jgi:putative OPT family oligopeptide transporter
MTERTTSVPELTIRVIILGLILSVVMGAANVYMGLKAGMTVSASIPAAVIAMLILRGIFGGGSILEANQVQTAASAGESLAAGIIFTMPALILIGEWQSFDYITTTLVAFTGGLLGILFMIPMRRVFVTGDNEELKYPEGVACASVLAAGAADGESKGDAMNIIKGGLLGIAFKFFAGFAGLLKGSLEHATLLGERVFFFGSDISPALLAVGIIVRLNVAALIFIGGAIGWLIAIPLLGQGASFESADAAAWGLWDTKIRYLGVGAMVIGGIASIVKVRHGLVQAVQEIRNKGARSGAAGENAPETDRDIPSKAIVFFATLAILLIGGLYYHLTGSIIVALPTTLIMVVMAFFFTAVASYIVGLVGNSNSPVSGMTITAVLFTGGLLYLFNFSGSQGMVATLGVAAIVCCAACTSGDVCNDLKTGHMVGASPFRQQIMQISGVAVASLVMAPVLQLLHDNTPGGIGGRELSAPQAGLFASLAKGFFGDGKLPWDMVAYGAVLGVVILIVDKILENKKAKFRAHLMPIAVGIYLPFGLSVPIFIGGLMAHFFCRGKKDEEADKAMHRGILFSSGIIAGESLMGVGLALLAAAQVSKISFDLGGGTITAMTWAAIAVTLVAFWTNCKPKEV